MMDCSVDEIAEQLKAPSGTIKSYLFRARRRLHGLLEAEGIDYA
jgi:DNA-directed RNA polymerase specialized sigma24 family protein